VNPSDEVHPCLDIQDMDEDALLKTMDGLFHVTDPQV
jgi:hypothetical protein